jgi:K+-transporting ATPase KdpF subunit
LESQSRFSPSAPPTPISANGCAESPVANPHPLAMENIVIGVIALACLAYLVVAVLRAEKF